MAKSKERIVSVGIILTVLLLFISIRFWAPTSWLAAMRPNHWSCDQASFIFDDDEPVVILEMMSRGGYRSPDISAIHTLSLKTREVQSSYYDKGILNVKGITKQHVWIVDDGELIGLRRDDLSEDINASELLAANLEIGDKVESIEVDGDLGTLRVEGLDGHHYAFIPLTEELTKLSLDVGPVQPSLQARGRQTFGGTIALPSSVEDELLLEKEPVYDIHSQSIIAYPNKDILLHYKSLKGPTGKLIIARVSESEQFVWKVTETDLFESELENGRTLMMSHVHDDVLYCVMQDYGGDEDVYVAAIDTSSGGVLWCTAV